MTISTDVLANRTMSAFPISIATSHALESIANGPQPPYDPERIIPQKINILEYEYFWINLLTIYRNIIGAVGTENVKHLLPADLIYAIEFELGVITDIINKTSLGKTKCIFYVSKYSNLEKKHPHATIRKDNTEKQRFYTNMMQQTINEFIKRQSKDAIKFYECDLKPETKSDSLILTNYAYDLLSYKHFNKLDLLESHTGVLKPKSMWYTKLLNGKDLNRIPFNSLSIQVFGDKETFSGMPHKVKSLILELAEKYQWTQVTSKDRIYYSLDRLDDKFLSTVLKTMI
jgi:hypothetical protein